MKTDIVSEILEAKMSTKAPAKSDTTPCSKCSTVLKTKTINKNGGVCGKCMDPNIGRKPCPGTCGKSYKESTFKKHNGYCAKCAREKNDTDESKSETKKTTRVAKTACSGTCGKSYSATSINESGLCKKCAQGKEGKEKTTISGRDKMPPVFSLLNKGQNGTLDSSTHRVPTVNNPRALNLVLNNASSSGNCVTFKELTEPDLKAKDNRKPLTTEQPVISLKGRNPEDSSEGESSSEDSA